MAIQVLGYAKHIRTFALIAINSYNNEKSYGEYEIFPRLYAIIITRALRLGKNFV